MFQKSEINTDAVTNAQFLYYFSMSVSSIDSFLRLKFRARECFSRSKGFLTGMGADLAHHVIRTALSGLAPFVRKQRSQDHKQNTEDCSHQSWLPGPRYSSLRRFRVLDRQTWYTEHIILSRFMVLGGVFQVEDRTEDGAAVCMEVPVDIYTVCIRCHLACVLRTGCTWTLPC